MMKSQINIDMSVKAFPYALGHKNYLWLLKWQMRKKLIQGNFELDLQGHSL